MSHRCLGALVSTILIYSWIAVPFEAHAEQIDIYPINMLAMSHDEYLYQMTTSTWKDPTTWRTRYQNHPDGERITRQENIDEIIEGTARAVCRKHQCGMSGPCQFLVKEEHIFRATSHVKEYYFTHIACSSEASDVIVPKPLVVEEVEPDPPVEHSGIGWPSIATFEYWSKFFFGPGPKPKVAEGVKEDGRSAAPAVVAPIVLTEPSAQDKAIIASLIEGVASLYDSSVKLEKPLVVQKGLANYLEERRARRKGLSREQLLSLIFSDSWKEDESGKDKDGEFIRSFHPDPDWFSGFGRVTDRSIESVTPHVDLVGRIRGISDLPKELALKVGGRHVRSMVYRVDVRGELAEYPQFRDFSEFHFKRPSPLLIRLDVNPEGYYTRVLCEVAAYRISNLLGFDVVDETRLMNEKVQGLGKSQTFLGSARRTADERFLAIVPDDLLEDVNDPHRWRPALSRLRVVDFLVRADDRHSDNMLFDSEHFEIRGLDYEGTLKGLAQSLATHPISGGRFPPSYDDPVQRRSRETIRERVIGVTFRQLHEALDDIATDEEVESVWLKVHILRADIQSR